MSFEQTPAVYPYPMMSAKKKMPGVQIAQIVFTVLVGLFIGVQFISNALMSFTTGFTVYTANKYPDMPELAAAFDTQGLDFAQMEAMSKNYLAMIIFAAMSLLCFVLFAAHKKNKLKLYNILLLAVAFIVKCVSTIWNALFYWRSPMFDQVAAEVRGGVVPVLLVFSLPSLLAIALTIVLFVLSLKIFLDKRKEV